MFNNVILDVAIGIVFIFLLYSLLATSVQEIIATILALRARTLKDGIINGMLCNTPEMSKMQSVLNGIGNFFKQIAFLFHKPKLPDEDKKLGHLFYDHPLIKSYGSNAVFSNPSYIPNGNFSAVLTDILKNDFDSKLDLIAAAKFKRQTGKLTLAQVKANLSKSADLIKIKELLIYYQGLYSRYEQDLIAWAADPDKNEKDKPLPHAATRIERQTLTILLMHLNNSGFQLSAFQKKLEDWFDDTMNRVSGWYKRQTQFILFTIGITLAVLLNVDIIQVAGKLSTDKDARAEMVQLAIKQADAYKDDPRIKGKKADSLSNNGLKAINEEYQQHLTEAKKTVDSGIVKANQLLALGWGDYGMKRDSEKLVTNYYQQHGPPLSRLCKSSTDLLFKHANIKTGAYEASADSLLDLLAYGSPVIKVSIAKKLTDTSTKHPLLLDNIAKTTLVDTFKKVSWQFSKQRLADSAALVTEKKRIVNLLKKNKTINAKLRDHKADSIARLNVKQTQQSKHRIPEPFAWFKINYTALKNNLLLEKEYGFWDRASFMWGQLTASKLLGFLLTAFAISLGAPFWFDLLSKLIKLRGAGKKEDGDNDGSNNTNEATPPSSVNVTLNNPSATGEEAAVG